MSVEFAGQLFDTEAQRLRVIAQEWLTAGGLNDAADIGRWLDTIPPAKLAQECIGGWWSGDAADTAPDPDDLAAAFADLAVNRGWLTE